MDQRSDSSVSEHMKKFQCYIANHGGGGGVPKTVLRLKIKAVTYSIVKNLVFNLLFKI